jgi:hypothetical protein
MQVLNFERIAFPGFSDRRNALLTRISAPISSKIWGVMPLTAPCVPTGIKQGVCSTLRLV